MRLTLKLLFETIASMHRATTTPRETAAPPDETRGRLLHDAAAVFGDVEFPRATVLPAAAGRFGARGSRRATVRDICARASANAAAVNYHFGDKDGLYSA